MIHSGSINVADLMKACHGVAALSIGIPSVNLGSEASRLGEIEINAACTNRDADLASTKDLIHWQDRLPETLRVIYPNGIY